MNYQVDVNLTSNPVFCDCKYVMSFLDVDMTWESEK